MYRLLRIGIILLFSANGWSDLTWSAVQTIAEGKGTGADPRVAVNSAGTAVAVWVDTANQIQASVLPLGGVWTAPTIISPIGVTAVGPRVIITEAGEAIAVWETSTGSIQAAHFSVAWDAPATISTMAGNSLAELATNRSNSPTIATAVWQRLNAMGNHEIIAAPFDFSMGSWSLPSPPIETSLGAPSPFPQVAMDIGGTRAIVTWSQFNGTSPVEGSTTSNPLSVAWGAPTLVSNAGASTGGVLATLLTMDSLEQALAVWVDAALGDQIRSNTFTSGSWGAMPLTITTDSGVNPQIALSTTGGHAIAVWEDNATMRVRVSTFTIGGMAWSAPIFISGAAAPLFPDVTIDNDENAVAIWREASVQASDSPLGGAWSTPFVFTGNPAMDFPMVASNDSGYVVAIWAESDGGMTLVKSATASFSSSPSVIDPPTGLSASRQFNEFPTQKEYFNRLSWQASPSAGIASYRIFRDGVLIGQVPASQLFFEDHRQPKNQRVTYAVRAVNSSGEESSAVSVTLN